MSLGRTKNIDNEKWVEAFANIEQEVTAEEIDKLEAATVESIKSTVSGKHAAFGWSGGKDSLVIAKLCELADVGESLFAHSELEYPAFLKWCLKNKPKGCEVVNVGLDLEWLSKHKEMLFPQDAKTAYRWYQLIQQTAIRRYFRSNKLDYIIVGHRTADGNYVGKGGNISTNGAGVVRYSPIADWTHEQLLAYIHYRNIPMPPIYGWKNGYKCGTHSWPGRTHTQSIERGFSEVYEIDKSIVKQAAEVLPEARHFLEGR